MNPKMSVSFVAAKSLSASVTAVPGSIPNIGIAILNFRVPARPTSMNSSPSFVCEESPVGADLMGVAARAAAENEKTIKKANKTFTQRFKINFMIAVS
jgi:hypothetical protein